MQFRVCSLLTFLMLAVVPVCAQWTLQAQSPAGTAPLITANDLPDPLALSADWWQFYNVDSEALSARIALAEPKYRALANELTGDDRAKVDPLVDRVIVTLKVLAAARKQPAPADFVPPDFRDTYSLDDFLRVRRELASTEASRATEEDLIHQVDDSITSAVGSYNDKLLRYRRLSDRSFDKLVLGLTLMGDRVALALVEQKRLLFLARVDELMQRSDHLEKELEHAQTHLQMSQLDLTQLARDVEYARTLLEQARNQAFRAEAEAVQGPSESALATAQALLLTQKSVHAKVQLSRARLREVQAEARYGLAYRAKAPSTPPTVTVGTVKEWQAAIDEEKGNIRRWQNTTRLEIERTAKALSGLGPEEGDGTRAVLRGRLDEAQATLVDLQQTDVLAAESSLLVDFVERQERERYSAAIRWVFEVWDWIVAVATATLAALRSGIQIGGTLLTFMDILYAVLVIFVALWFSRIFRAMLEGAASPQWGMSKSTVYALSRLIHYGILSVAVVIALAVVGLDMRTFAIIFGALSLGIGFGLQGIVNNFLSGLIILFERPLRVGDYLELHNGPRGRVTAINVRSTRLRTNDGIDVIVPNAQIIEASVTNWTMSDAFHRMHVPFCVAYGSDKELVRKVVTEAAWSVEFTLQGVRRYADPEVWLVNFGDSGLQFELVVWVNAHATQRYKSTQAAYYWAIHTALEKAKVQIPYRQYDFHVKPL